MSAFESQDEEIRPGVVVIDERLGDAGVVTEMCGGTCAWVRFPYENSADLLVPLKDLNVAADQSWPPGDVL